MRPRSAGRFDGSIAGERQTATTRTVVVWDPLVRIGHWLLVAGFVAVWLSADDWRDAHVVIGYAVIAVVLLRLIWGFVGTAPARFVHFVRGPQVVLAYLYDIARGHPRRYLGHNPAGGAMIVLLLGCMIVTALTGWLYTLDAFWGVAWVEELHELGANAMLFLVAAHVIGVIVASVSHHENLVAAMWHGRKRAAASDDVTAEADSHRR